MIESYYVGHPKPRKPEEEFIIPGDVIINGTVLSHVKCNLYPDNFLYFTIKEHFPSSTNKKSFIDAMVMKFNNGLGLPNSHYLQGAHYYTFYDSLGPDSPPKWVIVNKAANFPGGTLNNCIDYVNLVLFK